MKLRSGLIRAVGTIRFLPILFLALPFGILPGHAGQASAESPTQLTSMAVSVMPEYDKPSVFVSYRGELNTDVKLPLDVKLRLPAGASIDHACSMRGTEHICHTFTTKPDGTDYETLEYQAITSVIYVEYHYGSVAGAGQRDLTFNYWSPWPAQELDMFVGQPTQTQGFTLVPATSDIVGDALKHYSYSYQNVVTDKPVTLEMKYQRSTDAPSAPEVAQQAAKAQATQNGGGGGISATLLLSAGLAGAVLLAAVVYLTVVRRAQLRLVPFLGRRSAAAVEQPAPDSGIFCPACGATIRPGATFCSNCGQSAGPGGAA